jgi:hypothetical protein
LENLPLFERGKRTRRQVFGETGGNSIPAGVTPDSTRGKA